MIPLARMTFDSRPEPAVDIGTPGDLQWIEVGNLYIDPTYQRAILETGRKSIRRMVEAFSWSLFAPLVVSARGEGRFAIIDGQHRAIAAITHGGVKSLPCLVLNCSIPEEALAFATINGMVTKVSAQMIFRARVAAGDFKAKHLFNTCKRAGVTILGYPRQDCAVGETMAVGTLQACLDRYGADVLVESLQTVTKTGDGNKGLLREGVISGTCLVLAENAGWRGASLLKAVERAGIPTIYREAVARKGGSTTSGSFRTFYADVLRAKLKHLLASAPVAKSEDSGFKPLSREQLMRGRA